MRKSRLREIPREWEDKDFYAILSIKTDARLPEIRRAYKNLIREYHPDVYLEDDHKEKFEDITLAFSVLSNTENRALYDLYVQHLGKVHRDRRSVNGLLLRAAIFIVTLLILRSIGVIGGFDQLSFGAPGETTTASGGVRQNNANQVLALMVGPQGPPGVAGVAGRDVWVCRVLLAHRGLRVQKGLLALLG